MSTVIELAAAPLDRVAFRNRLVAAVHNWPCENTRLYALFNSGHCPRPLLLRYALATYHSANLFTATIAEMVERAPSASARLVLLENLMEEEGIFLRSSTGLVVRPERRHPALALRFLKACGGDESMLRSDVKHATGPGRQMLREGRWVEAVANLLVGQELRFSDAARLIRDALLKNGFSAHDVAFFTVHIDADMQHGEEALNLVLDHAHSRCEQEAAIAAAESGSRHWFTLHGGAARTIHHAQ